MADVISRFEKTIQKINLLYGLLVPLVLGIVMGRILRLTNPSFFRDDATAATINLFFYTVGLGVFIMHLFTKGKLSQLAHALIYIFYCLCISLAVLYLDPYPTPFYFQFIVLLIAVDLMFGERWFRLTVAYFAIIFLLSYSRSTEHMTLHGVMLAVTYIIGSTSVAFLVSKYRTISDQERHLLGKTTEQNEFERQRLLSLINNMGEAVVATDDHGKILLYNAAVLNLLDTNQSLDGKSLNKVLNLKDAHGQPVLLTTLLEKSSLGLTETDLTHEYSPEDFINMYINIAPVKLGFKEDTDSGFIIIMRDITKEKSLEEERDEFISVVSHELRTPVAIAEGGISNAVFAIEKKVNKKQILDALNESHEQVLFLSNMINDLATLSRAERSDAKLEINKVAPDELLHEIGRDYTADAEQKGLKLTVTAAKSVTAIQSSELYLREILQNFITNSLKYTKEGSVVIHVRSDLNGSAIFSVADTGIGLSKSDQKRIFEKFFRSEDYRTRESSGTGLGLYVTAKLAHKLKATIEVDSKLNKGSTFTITVPSLKK